MPTHADLAAKLLQDAAGFFRDVGQQNPGVSEQMNQNAEMFEQVAQLVASDPMGELPLPPEGEAPL
ncbi:hypothetical protein E5222_04660 [Alteraurantiacibacter aquimixticola]|uniref:Uncharacterized protein n=2 Tax=Alteraurantiacibacter aquimixticola TaxID=2489173 RepID=A0A4T3F5S2_9SPHN|nr:hypothetical protein E5222_04660 [Alteraurantiacibacter aquimixticola]